MKRVYVNEDRCLGCHLCEYYCAFANSGETNMAKTFKLNRNPIPRITVESIGDVNFADSAPPTPALRRVSQARCHLTAA